MNKYIIPRILHPIQVENFLLNFTVTFANWMLVLICMERWVTVRFPLQVGEMGHCQVPSAGRRDGSLSGSLCR